MKSFKGIKGHGRDNLCNPKFRRTLLVSERGLLSVTLENAEALFRRFGIPEEASFEEAQAFLAELGLEDFADFQRYLLIHEHLDALRAADAVTAGTDPVVAEVPM